MKKKVVSVICAFVLSACCFPMDSQAKVIEPEIVKTEKWTTSYYIDDDIDTLYPYIQCEADIYNDGTIKLYMWNTHEWDGFATVTHTATVIQTAPMPKDSMTYCFIKNGEYTDSDGIAYVPVTAGEYSNLCNNGSTTKPSCPTEYKNIDPSFYPNDYLCRAIDGGDTESHPTGFGGAHTDCNPNYYKMNVSNVKSIYYVYYDSLRKCWHGSSSLYGMTILNVNHPQYAGSLPEMPFGENKKYFCTFTPENEITNAHEFRLFGHDITITPELLSGNVIATPQLTEQEEYIKKLEAENAALKAENEQLKSQISILSKAKFCDVNQDDVVDVSDAQLVLMYYTESIAGLTKGDPIEIWYTKRNTIDTVTG